MPSREFERRLELGVFRTRKAKHFEKPLLFCRQESAQTTKFMQHIVRKLNRTTTLYPSAHDGA